MPGPWLPRMAVTVIFHGPAQPLDRQDSEWGGLPPGQLVKAWRFVFLNLLSVDSNLRADAEEKLLAEEQLKVDSIQAEPTGFSSPGQTEQRGRGQKTGRYPPPPVAQPRT